MKLQIFKMLALILLLLYAAWLLILAYHFGVALALVLVGLIMLLRIGQGWMTLMEKRKDFLTRLLDEHPAHLSRDDIFLLNRLRSKGLF